jgi:integrase
MNIKRNIIFSLESRKKDGIVGTGNVPIRMRVVYGGKRVEFSTGYRIDTEKWDVEKQRVKVGCANKLKQTASEINAELFQYYTDIQTIFKKFEIEGVKPTPEQLKQAFNDRNKKVEPDEIVAETPKVDFMEVFDEFVAENGKQSNWVFSTYQKLAGVRKLLVEFDADLSFEDWDERKLNAYIDFLRGKDMRNSSIDKQVDFLKWFLRWAARMGHNCNTAFESFKSKLKSTQKKVIFLTVDELNRLRNYEIPESKKYLERVRDVFLFCCFTGLRYSDVYNLKRSDVKESHIEVTTVKTADSLIIELNNHSRAILDKYKDVAFAHHKVLPVVSNKNMNNYIKELGELAGIDEPVRETYYKGNRRIDAVTPKYALLGSHVGRRTFICNALSLGIPPQVVMKWTGHSDYKAMKPYIDIADDIKAGALDRFNRL